MAWIVKDSAHAKIERRDEPYLTDKMRKQFDADLLPRYERKRAALLPILHAVQEQYGYLPYQALEEVGEYLGIAAAEVWDTATFYEQFFLHPKGKYLIQICQSISCELCGHKGLLDKVQKKLGIAPHETTDDGKFTLVALECLGSCGTAPAMLINDKLHENMTWEKLEKTLDELPD